LLDAILRQARKSIDLSSHVDRCAVQVQAWKSTITPQTRQGVIQLAYHQSVFLGVITQRLAFKPFRHAASRPVAPRTCRRRNFLRPALAIVRIHAQTLQTRGRSRGTGVVNAAAPKSYAIDAYTPCAVR
jgi:hypothetical protein